MAKTKIIVTIGLVIILPVLFWCGYNNKQKILSYIEPVSIDAIDDKISEGGSSEEYNIAMYPPAFFDEYLFYSGTKFADNLGVDNAVGRFAIVPHHLLASNIIADIIKRVAQTNPSTIIILAPNHYERGSVAVSSFAKWDTPIGSVDADKKIVREVVELPFVAADGDRVLAAEHAVGNLVPFIKYYLPQTKIVPIVLRRGISRAQIDELVIYLTRAVSNPTTAILASVDFAHGVTPAESEQINAKVRAYLQQRLYDDIISCGSACSDAPQVLVTLLKTLDVVQSVAMNVVHDTNSANITRQQTNNITSYLGIIFENNQ